MNEDREELEAEVREALRANLELGYVEMTSDGKFKLTEAGKKHAEAQWPRTVARSDVGKMSRGEFLRSAEEEDNEKGIA